VVAADQRDVPVPVGKLERAAAPEPPAIGLRLVVAPLNLLGDGTRSRTRVRLQAREPAAGKIAAFVDVEALQLWNRCPAVILHSHAGRVEPRSRPAQGVGFAACSSFMTRSSRETPTRSDCC